MSIEPTICSHCGASNLPGQAVCGACGKRLSAFAALKILPEYLLEPRTALLVLFSVLVGSIILFTLAFNYFMSTIGLGVLCSPSLILIIAGVSIIKLNSRLARKNGVSVYAAADKTVGAIVYAIAIGAIVYGIFFIPVAVPFLVFAELSYFAPRMFVINVLTAVIAAVITYRKLQAKRSVLP